MSKKESRLRRARKTRARIAEMKALRLAVHKSNNHIYAQIISADSSMVLVSASTLEAEMRPTVQNLSNTDAAKLIGQRIAEKAKMQGITDVAFDRSGFKYHGRVKMLADAAREHGLQF
jgi:large subunit ribosomal protein L18